MNTHGFWFESGKEEAQVHVQVQRRGCTTKMRLQDRRGIHFVTTVDGLLDREAEHVLKHV